MIDIENMTYDTAIDFLNLKRNSTALNNRKQFILGYLWALSEQHYLRIDKMVNYSILNQIECVHEELKERVEDIEEHSDPYDKDEHRFKIELLSSIDRLERFTVRIAKRIVTCGC